MAKKVITGFLFLFFILTCLHILGSAVKLSENQTPDFNVFYYSAKDILDGANPYQNTKFFTGLGYPVFSVLPYIPFTFFSYAIAQTIFLLLNIISILTIVLVSLKIILKKFDLRYFLLFSSLAILYFPTKFTLGMGQSNLIAYLILLISLLFYREKHIVKAGIMLGLSLVIKPILGFMILFFIYKKSWRISIVASGILISFFLLTLSVFGFDIYIYYFKEMIPHLLKPEGREIYYNQGISGLISRFIEDESWRRIITIISSIVPFLITIYFVKKYKANENLIFASLLVLLVMIDTLSWQHHFVFLIFPYILSYHILIRKKEKVLLFLLFISYLMTFYNIKDTSAFSYTWISNIILSHAFFGSLMLWLLVIWQIRKK